MKILSRMSIKNKLVLVILAVTLVSLAAGSVVFVVTEQRQQERELIRDVGAEARMLADYCAVALAYGQEEQVAETFEHVSFVTDVEHAALFSPSGRLIACSGDEQPVEHYVQVSPGSVGVTRLSNHVVAQYQAVFQGRSYGTVHLHSSVSTMADTLSGQLQAAVIVLVLLILLSFVLASVLQAIISRPLATLASAANRVAHRGEYDIEAPDSRSGDEIGQVSESFREMLAVLKEREEAQRKTEAALQASETRFRRLFTELTSGLALHEMVYNDDGRACDYRFLEVNPAFERLTGLKADELIGRTVREVIPGIEDFWIERYAQVVETGKPAHLSFASEPLGRHYEVLAYSPKSGQFATIFQDVTERIIADQNVRLFKTMSDKAGHGASYSDLDGRIVYINDAYLRMLGYEREEVVGKNISMFHPRKVRPTLEKNRQELLKKETITAHPQEHLRKDGSTFPGLMNLALIRDDDGSPAYVAITTIDISELARAEQRLRTERDLAQKYLDVAATPMITIGADQRLSMVNRKGCEMLGYSEEELIGRNWFDTCLPEDLRKTVKEVFDQLMAGEIEPASYFENPVLTKSGEIRHFGWFNTIINDEEGNIVGTLSSGIDLTERKWTEEVMRTILEGTSASVGEDFFRHLVSRLATSLGCRYAMVGELCGEGASRVRTLARWLSDRFGTQIEYDIEGAPCEEVLKDNIVYYDADVNQHFPKNEILAGLNVAWYMGVPLNDSEGKPLGVMSLMSDRPPRDVELVKSMLLIFAGRAATEIERQRAGIERENLVSDLETKNAELERFTYTVSHDLKSPIITIRGFLGLLRQDIDSGDSRRIGQDISRIANAAGKMQQLLDELLKLSRIGRQVHPTESVSLYEAALEAEELLSAQIESAGAHIEINPQLPSVIGDRPRLREVMQNLLDNSLKYRGEQASLTVRIGLREDDNETVFFVEDNGMGIPPEYHQTVFGLFDKLDNDSEGSGVGLSLVKRIVEQHGGRIWIESEGSGCGSRFCFTLGQEVSDEVAKEVKHER